MPAVEGESAEAPLRSRHPHPQTRPPSGRSEAGAVPRLAEGLSVQGWRRDLQLAEVARGPQREPPVVFLSIPALSFCHFSNTYHLTPKTYQKAIDNTRLPAILYPALKIPRKVTRGSVVAILWGLHDSFLIIEKVEGKVTSSREQREYSKYR